MRGKRFCLFAMAFIAMALCFMLGHGLGSGSVQSAPEEPRLEAIYDKPVNRHGSEGEDGPEPRGEGVEGFGFKYAILQPS